MSTDEVIDRLYGLPLGQFTQARNQAARELRKEGQREAAERVRALRKPTATAAGVNRLVREHRGEVEQFLRAAAVLRDAQFSGKGDLASATKQERAALEPLIRFGGEAVRQTLLAAAADDDAAKLLLEARLERELEPRGFGTLLAHMPPSAERSTVTTPADAKPPPARQKKPDDTRARSRLQEAQAVLRAAEAQEQRARLHWEETQRELQKARLAVEKAQRDLDMLQGR